MPGLIILSWEQEPYLCQAVIRETQAYRRRLPLPAPLAPRRHAPLPRDVTRRLDQDYNEVYKEIMSLPRHALGEKTTSELDDLERAAEDWSLRNKAVFRSRTVPRWLQPGTAAAQMYECVMDELIQDLQDIVRSLYANWSKVPKNLAERKTALDTVLMQATVIFVRTFWDPCNVVRGNSMS